MKRGSRKNVSVDSGDNAVLFNCGVRGILEGLAIVQR
jgi:hypothetical protein